LFAQTGRGDTTVQSRMAERQNISGKIGRLRQKRYKGFMDNVTEETNISAQSGR
jgi:hypothetical protein